MNGKMGTTFFKRDGDAINDVDGVADGIHMFLELNCRNCLHFKSTDAVDFEVEEGWVRLRKQIICNI